MFSPSQLISSLVQKTPSATVKPVELTPGQVFKGTVVKHYPDQMALVQIGGMQVQAKLEANLEAGQKAWLQVQPSTGVVTLKVLDAPVEAPGKEASLENLMRSLGIAETKESKAIVQALVNANLPVTKEVVQAFAQVTQRIGMDDSTVDAFLLAMKRNLPLTPDSVAGLKAFMSGKPLGQTIQNFLQQAAMFLGEEASGENKLPGQPSPMGQAQSAGMTNADIRQVVSQLKEKLKALPLLVAAGESGEDGVGSKPVTQGGVASTGGQQAAGSNASQNAPQTLIANPQTKAPTGGSAPAASALNTAPGQALTGQGADRAVAQTNLPGATQPLVAGEKTGAPEGSPAVRQTTAAVAPSLQPVTPNTGSTALAGATGNSQMSDAPHVQANLGQTAGLPLVDKQAAATASGQTAVGITQSTTMAANTSGTSSANPLVELFRHLGINHERGLMGQALGQQQADAGVHKQIETVKSLLLQINQAPAQSVPVALRDAADQLLQQVTGQQLMMVQPSNQALSQIVLQIPIRQAEGEETAFVQIESKKQGSGKLDPENCRLFFHLELKGMGTTMIDVGIVNRIVNLQIFNDSPWLEALAQDTKDRFAQQLNDVGYHLSAMRIQPVPDRQSKPAGSSQAKGALFADYRGMDVRV
ncbi:hypothetical protein AV540_08840 [Brevibacillus parabrevis]|uniref:hypothetical protein n=1 Tax=Brevibacillus parabrevis TaxID=54914 RepID=UPI0007AB351F|nr:hypothetical protein [Brevibacillus parabrevis]KZE53151.1 hypothetical protein AV540_08840 [Brevibacillus parabrevis]